MNRTWTSKKLANLEVRCITLYNQIQRWCKVQLVYMPCVGGLLTQTVATTADSVKSPSVEPAESLLLHLPSSLSPSLRQSPELSAVIKKNIVFMLHRQMMLSWAFNANVGSFRDFGSSRN
jgi:hypothetical protein